MQKSQPTELNPYNCGSGGDRPPSSKRPRVSAKDENIIHERNGGAILGNVLRVVLAGNNFQPDFSVLREELKPYGLVDRICTHSRRTPGGDTVLVFDIRLLIGQSRDDLQNLASCKRVRVVDLSAYAVHAPYLVCSGVGSDVTAETIIETVDPVFGNEEYEIYLFSGERGVLRGSKGGTALHAGM